MYDVVVVGAGPAGSVCAHDCARHGLDTLLLEKEEFPRGKPCGGALPMDIVKSHPDLEPMISRRTTWTRMLLNYETIVEHQGERAMFTRVDLDEFLARKAENAGVELQDGQVAASIDVTGEEVAVRTDRGATHRCRLVVDATGAKGTFFHEHKQRAKERLTYKVVSMVLEAPCPNDVIDRRLENDHEKDRDFYNAYLMTGFMGYGWVFPKDGLVNVGLGTVTTHSNGLKDHFLEFLKRIGFDDLDRSSLTAGLIPVVLLPQLWLPRVLFVGDAGGFVNALTGSGICYGMCSGENAALVAKEAVDADDFGSAVLSKYDHACADIRRELSFRTTALYYLAGAVKRGLDRPRAVRLLVRTMLPWLERGTPSRPNVCKPIGHSIGIGGR